MNNLQNNKNSMAAFLMNENLIEPATRTLDIVRLVFHFCNFVNLTLGGIAFGVGIGYDLVPINVSEDSSLKSVQTKFIITGVFVLIHGLIGAYGFVSRQSRSLILYGCLGLCLLIVGSVAAWSAKTREKGIINQSRNTFYTSWKEFDGRIDKFVEDKDMIRVDHTDCECRRVNIDEDGVTHLSKIMDCWSAREGLSPTTTDSNTSLSDDDKFIWNLICVEKSCHMRYIPDTLDSSDPLFSSQVEGIEDQPYYGCKNQTACTTEDNCDVRCDSARATYDRAKCVELCTEHHTPYTCIRYVRVLTKHRVVTMYVILFSLSVTQTVCLLCDILFIFWSLKEEVDIEIHQTADAKDCKRLSTKLQLLNRFLPCCFRIPEPAKRQSNVALSDIFSASEQDSSPVVAVPAESSSSIKT